MIVFSQNDFDGTNATLISQSRFIWRLVLKKTVFFAWASTLNMGLINKVDMVCLSPVEYVGFIWVKRVSFSTKTAHTVKFR